MESIEAWAPEPTEVASFAEKLLGKRESALSESLLRIVTASALSYGFGLAASLGSIAPARLGQALGLAAVPLAFAVFYAPSLWVLLTLFGRTISVASIGSAAVRAVSVSGLVLGGLIPAVAFFELTGGDASSYFAAFLELVALTTAGILGLRTFVRDVCDALPREQTTTSTLALVLGVAILGLALGGRFHPATITNLHGGFDHEHQHVAH